MNRMQRLLAVGGCLVALGALPLAACGDDDDDAGKTTGSAGGGQAVVQGAPAQTAKVAVKDNSFTAEVTVAKGGKVTWDWAGSSGTHSVIGKSANATALLKSERFSGGKGTYEVTFSEAGTYQYECGVHGSSMSGTVKVQ